MLDIRALLAYSSVCGIGFDTGSTAFRLNKPLTVRLFPVPGLKAGDKTAFESADLCNCAVLALA